MCHPMRLEVGAIRVPSTSCMSWILHYNLDLLHGLLMLDFIGGLPSRNDVIDLYGSSTYQYWLHLLHSAFSDRNFPVPTPKSRMNCIFHCPHVALSRLQLGRLRVIRHCLRVTLNLPMHSRLCQLQWPFSFFANFAAVSSHPSDK